MSFLPGSRPNVDSLKSIVHKPQTDFIVLVNSCSVWCTSITQAGRCSLRQKLKTNDRAARSPLNLPRVRQTRANLHSHWTRQVDSGGHLTTQTCMLDTLMYFFCTVRALHFIGTSIYYAIFCHQSSHQTHIADKYYQDSIFFLNKPAYV